MGDHLISQAGWTRHNLTLLFPQGVGSIPCLPLYVYMEITSPGHDT